MPEYTPFTHELSFSFSKKATTFTQMARYVGVRAAVKISFAQYRTTGTLPQQAPGWVLITDTDEVRSTFWFEYAYNEYMIIIRDITYTDTHISGVATVWKEDGEPPVVQNLKQ